MYQVVKGVTFLSPSGERASNAFPKAASQGTDRTNKESGMAKNKSQPMTFTTRHNFTVPFTSIPDKDGTVANARLTMIQRPGFFRCCP